MNPHPSPTLLSLGRPRLRPRGRFPVLLSVLLAGFLAFTTACEIPEGPRELEAPRLETRRPFQVGGGSADGTVAEAEGTPPRATTFEERLRQRSAPSRDAAEGDTVSVQKVALGGELMGELRSDRGWRWARSGDVTLAIHERSGEADALLYLQTFTSTGSRRPSMEAHRFHLAVDRNLATRPMSYRSDLSASAVTAAPVLPLTTGQILSAVEMLRTPTLGRGLGYRSEPDSFTGWRWIGTNRHGTLLRLGRTRGTWGNPLPLADEVELLLEVLSEETPELTDLLWQEPGQGVAESRAWMVLGSASRDDGRGAHLAILCRLRPTCGASADLDRFLDSLRPPDTPGGLDVRLGSHSVEELALGNGLTLYTGEDLPSPALLTQALARTAEARRAVRPADGPTVQTAEGMGARRADTTAEPGEEPSPGAAAPTGADQVPETVPAAPDATAEERTPHPPPNPEQP